MSDRDINNQKVDTQEDNNMDNQKVVAQENNNINNQKVDTQEDDVIDNQKMVAQEDNKLSNQKVLAQEDNVIDNQKVVAQEYSIYTGYACKVNGKLFKEIEKTTTLGDGTTRVKTTRWIDDRIYEVSLTWKGDEVVEVVKRVSDNTSLQRGDDQIQAFEQEWDRF